ncbi:MAG: FAD-dependent oxidoreductase [Acidimicrobiia bacterium]
MADVDTVLIGAGPASLAVALALCDSLGAESVMAVDPAGTWMADWRRRFRAHRIEHLRSSVFHHPHPDPDRFLDRCSESDMVVRDQYRLPGSGAFDRFIDEAVSEAGISHRVIADCAVDVCQGRTGVRVETASGSPVEARRAVVATNPRSHQESGWYAIRGAETIDLNAADLVYRRILVLGGGLTAARLAVAAVEGGADVTLAARRKISVRPFDILPGWMGPRFLRGFEAEPSWVERRRMVADGREGTMPPWARRSVGESVGRGLRLKNGIAWELEPAGEVVVARFADGSVDCFDEVWQAFGGSPDVASSPLLTRVAQRHPNGVIDGLPVLDEELRWPGTDIHVVGALAALQLGPGAGNLHGHRRAARRVVGVVASCLADPASPSSRHDAA